MRKWTILASVFVGLWATPLMAQQTTVTATVKDPTGRPYNFGTGNASLINNAMPGAQEYSGTFPVPRSYTIIGLNGNGVFSMVLYDNNQLTPAGSQYIFRICWQDTITCFNTGAITVTGSSVDLSSAISAFAVPLPPSGGGGSFATLTGGTNTSAIMTVGSGASLGASGTGTINATGVPFGGISTGTNTSGAMTVSTGASLGVSGTGTIAATGTATAPTQCSAAQAPTGINSTFGAQNCTAYYPASAQTVYAQQFSITVNGTTYSGSVIADGWKVNDGQATMGTNTATRSSGTTWEGAAVGQSVAGQQGGSAFWPLNTTITSISSDKKTLTLSNNAVCNVATPCAGTVAGGAANGLATQVKAIHDVLCGGMLSLSRQLVILWPPGMIYGWSAIGGNTGNGNPSNDCTAGVLAGDPAEFLGQMGSAGVHTDFLIPPEMDWKDCPGNNMGGCIAPIANAEIGYPLGPGNVSGTKFQNMEWDGLGINSTRDVTPVCVPNSISTGSPVIFLTQMEADNLYVHDVCPNVVNFSLRIDNGTIAHNINISSVGINTVTPESGVLTFDGGEILDSATGVGNGDFNPACCENHTNHMLFGYVNVVNGATSKWFSNDDDFHCNFLSFNTPCVQFSQPGQFRISNCVNVPRSAQSAFRSGTVSGMAAYIRNCQITLSGSGAKAFDLNGVRGSTAGPMYVLEGNVCSGSACTDDTALLSTDVALSAGWGSTAAVSSPTGHTYLGFGFTVTANGTGIVANPTITVTNPVPDQFTPNMTCKQVDGTGNFADVTGEDTASTTSVTLTWHGTPTAASTYIFSCTVQGAI